MNKRNGSECCASHKSVPNIVGSLGLPNGNGSILVYALRLRHALSTLKSLSHINRLRDQS
jgi:hypothetical protein